MTARLNEEALDASLLFIQRTTQRLLERNHPDPRRAGYLLSVHAGIVDRELANAPKDGWP